MADVTPKSSLSATRVDITMADVTPKSSMFATRIDSKLTMAEMVASRMGMSLAEVSPKSQKVATRVDMVDLEALSGKPQSDKDVVDLEAPAEKPRADENQVTHWQERIADVLGLDYQKILGACPEYSASHRQYVMHCRIRNVDLQLGFSKELVQIQLDCILMLMTAFAVSILCILLLCQGAGGIGTSLFATFVAGGLVWMNRPFLKPLTSNKRCISYSAPSFDKTNHVFMKALAFTVCIYGATWEHSNSTLLEVSCVGCSTTLMSVLVDCVVSFYRYYLKFRRRRQRASSDQPETKDVPEENEDVESNEDVVKGAAESAVEKVHKEKIAKAKTGELDSVEQPEARAGDGDARSLNYLPIVVAQALAFFQMLGMSVELQLKIPGIEVPPIMRDLARFSFVLTFESFEMPVPETAAMALRILAPVAILWSCCVQNYSHYREHLLKLVEDHKDTNKCTYSLVSLCPWPLGVASPYLLQFGPCVLGLIISLASGATWGIVIGASCLVLILLSRLVKAYLRRSYETLGREEEFDFTCLGFDAHVLLLLYGASYLGPLRALTGIYMSDSSTAATGWIGTTSGIIFSMFCIYLAIGAQKGRDYFKENLSWKITKENGLESERETMAVSLIKYLYDEKSRSIKCVLILFFFFAVPFFGGLAAPFSFEQSLIAALGVVFVILPLAVMYFWNMFNEHELELEDPFHENRRLVASLLPLERAAGIGIVELLVSQPDIQLVLFFATVTFFLSLMLVSQPHNERNDFFNELALRCSVAVVAGYAVDMRFDFGMAGPREAAAVGVSIAAVLWVLVALGPIELPRALFANTRSAFRNAGLQIAIAKGDMKRAADILLTQSDPGLQAKLKFLKGAGQAEFKEANPDASFFLEERAEAHTLLEAVAKLYEDDDKDVYRSAEGVLIKWLEFFGTVDDRGNQDLIDLLVKLDQGMESSSNRNRLEPVRLHMAKVLGIISLPEDPKWIQDEAGVIKMEGPKQDNLTVINMLLRLVRQSSSSIVKMKAGDDLAMAPLVALANMDAGSQPVAAAPIDPANEEVLRDEEVAFFSV
eukprot:gnl/MRDRNA2_/MRDRNA2_28854_c0_seq1.p1 gnl/MRDRNA2_/MRDRNA2_28854_c0~~gnl/MRDRNA2_/MRDRNA2_28854_c0_seq1.p1  ORF type:complete len:1085 (+),score=201.68 gnl/MRDRNA2_/MRDRNA2_28854_c0_seq1:102-3257(+)